MKTKNGRWSRRKYAKISAHSSGAEYDKGGCYDGEISGSSGGRIMCFIYDATIVETTSWEDVVKNYMILKRYDLTEDELNKMNWTITYP